MFNRIGKTNTMRALWMVPGLALLAPLSATELAAQERDFMLKAPQVTLSIKGGYSMPRLGSGGDMQSLWDFTQEHLTVGNRDFDGPHAAFELGLRGSERLDLVVGLGHSSSSVPSEFRKWEGEDGLPITQTTEFTTTPLTAGVKAYLRPRGRSIGSYAWVPRNFNAFAGVAGGVVWYRFEQAGEFVDEATQEIFIDNFRTVEKGATVHFFAGLDIGLNKRTMLTGEARYELAKAPMQYYYDGSSDFVGFPDLDLSGFKVSVGVGLRL